MKQQKRIALVAHDNKKRDLLEWAMFNRLLLLQHELYATGTTGELLEQELGATVHKLQSGPLGGDQQIGARFPLGHGRDGSQGQLPQFCVGGVRLKAGWHVVVDVGKRRRSFLRLTCGSVCFAKRELDV